MSYCNNGGAETKRDNKNNKAFGPKTLGCATTAQTTTITGATTITTTINQIKQTRRRKK
jgi:hypothetical protein